MRSVFRQRNNMHLLTLSGLVYLSFDFVISNLANIKCPIYAVLMDTMELIRRFDIDLTNKEDNCLHPGFKYKICFACGREANDHNPSASYMYKTSIPFKYIHTDLRYSIMEIGRLKDENTKKMLRQRKLHLVLDLDETLLHTVSPKEYETYLSKNKTDASTIEKPYVNPSGHATKISPYVQVFLKKVSTMFDMYVYTMGNRNYAKEMTRLLDPEGVYFGSRIVSKEDSIKKDIKGLDVILGNENATLILDDSKRVWRDKDEDNLILIERYCYFAPGSRRGKIYYNKMIKTDDSKDERALGFVLKLLEKVHMVFFEENDKRKNDQRTITEIDVRNILKIVQGCGLPK